jgi:hypothetical protein
VLLHKTAEGDSWTASKAASQPSKILCPGKELLDQSATRCWRSDRLDGCGANARMGDLGAEQVFVVGEDATALTATGNGDVELLAVDGGEGAGRGHEQDVIDSFPLCRMGRDDVTVREGAVVGRQSASIAQENGLARHSFHLEQFAVDELPGTIRLQQQLVAVRIHQTSPFPYVKAGTASIQFE